MLRSRRTGVFAAAIALAALVCAGQAARAEVRLPKVFASHMVLQRDMPLTVWGWDRPGQAVTVEVAGARAETHANDRGEWKVKLPALEAGGPHTMTVRGSSAVSLEDVLVGEVWLCSGQSNMEMGIGAVDNAQAEIAAANYPQIRLLMVHNRFTPLPMDDIEALPAIGEGVWKVCSPKTIAEGGWGGFSAAGYFFGRELFKRLNVPIGLIDADWGGTVIQTWTPPEGFALTPALKNEYERVLLGDPRTPQHQERLAQALKQYEQWLSEAKKALVDRTLVPPLPPYPPELTAPSDVQQATALYNGMIHPLVPFGIRGAIWYQGESNLGDGMTYTERMKALVGGWRKVWGEGDFPFYYVQIAPFNYGGNPFREPEFWVAQTAAMAIPNTGMAVINDIGNLADIHPKNKQDVGKRLALWALAKTYGKSDIVYQGPTFHSMRTEGNSLIVTFDNVGGGLKSRDGKPLSWFEIIDADEGGFVKADARIDGASVALTAPGVKKPVALRFAWSMLAEPNLCNAEGLPANSFRAGEVPKRDLLALNVPEARDYTLVYDLDLGKLGPNIVYDVDNHARITRPFDRIAYFVELTLQDGSTQFVYVSMDAFTNDPGKIGIPTVASGARYQQNVKNLTVLSNVKTIVPGQNLAGGNIEFWPDNYGPQNAASVPNASDQRFDFGDQPSDPRDGYGCMQVHNHDARQTLFSINNWKAGAGADLGIGNRTAPGTEPDWTFAGNAGSYLAKRLRVLVRLKP